MEKVKIPEFRLTGIKLDHKTSNTGGRSNIDCGNLWQKFEKENLKEHIPGKLSNEIYAVYYDYEGDHTRPFLYFIGCKVKPDAGTPEGMMSLVIPEQGYIKLTAKGKMPDCIANAWKEIWNLDRIRKYGYDFEVYDQRSHDWNNAEVDIYVSSEDSSD